MSSQIHVRELPSASLWNAESFDICTVLSHFRMLYEMISKIRPLASLPRTYIDPLSYQEAHMNIENSRW